MQSIRWTAISVGTYNTWPTTFSVALTTDFRHNDGGGFRKRHPTQTGIVIGTVVRRHLQLKPAFTYRASPGGGPVRRAATAGRGRDAPHGSWRRFVTTQNGKRHGAVETMTTTTYTLALKSWRVVRRDTTTRLPPESLPLQVPGVAVNVCGRRVTSMTRRPSPHRAPGTLRRPDDRAQSSTDSCRTFPGRPFGVSSPSSWGRGTVAPGPPAVVETYVRAAANNIPFDHCASRDQDDNIVIILVRGVDYLRLITLTIDPPLVAAAHDNIVAMF